MSNQDKQKAKAALKIASGIFEIAAAGALITGHGVMAFFVRKPMPRCHIASIQMQAGEKLISQGWRDWKAAK